MNYNMKGKILVLTVNGGGKADILFKNITITAVLEGGVIEKGGEPHYKLDSFKLKLDPKLIVYDMENIIGGRKDLSDEVNKVLNENWDAFFKETQLEFEEMLDQFFMHYANNVFRYVPV